MHALTDTTYDHSILFPIHLARKCLIWNKKCSSFSETLSLLFVCVCVFARAFRHMHFLAPPRTSWLSSKSYLLDTAPGISLLIVQLCRSGMATEPRHCTQKYPSWNHMRHRFWCGTETNITSKVNALLNTTHYKDGTCFAVKQPMSS